MKSKMNRLKITGYMYFKNVQDNPKVIEIKIEANERYDYFLNKLIIDVSNDTGISYFEVEKSG